MRISMRNVIILGSLVITGGLVACQSDSAAAAQSRVLVAVAQDGFDNMQYTVADARLRAAGYRVTVAAPAGGTARGTLGLEITADLALDEARADDYAALLILGGPGVSGLYDNGALHALCGEFNDAGKIIGALEKAPVILARAGVFRGQDVIVWPTETEQFAGTGARPVQGIVLRSDNFVTGLGGADETDTEFIQTYIDAVRAQSSFLGIVFPPQAEGIDLQIDRAGTRFVMTHAGVTRTGRIFVPAGYDGSRPYSLVFGLHGQAGTGLQFETSRGFDAIAGDFDFIMVYPDGYNRDWDILPRTQTRFDDVGFFRELIAGLKKKYAIDPDRVYVTGHSLGGFLAYHLAYDLSDCFTAAAPVAGLVYTPSTGEAPPRPVSILHLHAVDDWNVPFGGDSFYDSGVYPNPVPVRESIAFWKKMDGVTGPGREFFSRNGITGTVWTSEDGKSDVALLQYPHGGHGWPPFAEEEIFRFFYNHPARGNDIRFDYRALPSYVDTGAAVMLRPDIEDQTTIKKMMYFINGRAVGDSSIPPFALEWTAPGPGVCRITGRAALADGSTLASTSNQTIRVVRPDLARGATVRSSSAETDFLGAENAVDGDPYTRWASAWQDPQWLSVDLGRTRTVNGVTLVWETAFAEAFDVQVSTDNAQWRSVYASEQGRGGTETIAFSPVKARYVRMYGRRRATQWGYSLWDLLVHGE